MKLQEASTDPTWLPGHVIVGFVLSDTTTSKLQFAVFDAPSVAVKTIFVVPTPTIVPAIGDCVTLGEAVQLSAAVAKPV